MKQRISITTVAIVLSIMQLQAQNDNEKVEMDFGVIVGLTTGSCNYSVLNQSLLNAGYPQLSPFQIGTVFGIGMLKISDYAYTSYTTNFTLKSANDASNYYVSFYNTSIIADINVKVLNQGRLFIHPFAGFGFNFSKLDITDKHTLNNSFDSTLSNLSGRVIIETDMYYSVDIGFSVNISDKYNLSYWGIRTGYLIPFGKTNWILKDNGFHNDPDINIGRLFIGLTYSFF